jgi:hypothetical protein
VAQRLPVATDQLPGRVHLQVDLRVAVPREPIGAAYLLQALAQAQKAINVGARAAGGGPAFLLAPSVKGVDVPLTRCCAETLTLQPGQDKEAVRENNEGILTVSKATLNAAAGAVLVTSAPVAWIGVDAK